MYLIKTQRWLPWLLPRSLVWKMPATVQPAVYLTFDDGPHPVATPFVLQELEKHGAYGTFFCIGKNVQEYPELFSRIKAGKHAIGNHTQNHLNGWKTDAEAYLANVSLADKVIGSPLFRPPYGRIRRKQVKRLRDATRPYSIIMWDVLSADFDTGITPQQCLDNVLNNITPGSIVVFHDSAKAYDRMHYALPRVLDFCKEKGWQCLAID